MPQLIILITMQEVRNTIGNIPMEWYEDYPHLGYDLDGKRIGKPLKRDEVNDYCMKYGAFLFSFFKCELCTRIHVPCHVYIHVYTCTLL